MRQREIPADLSAVKVLGDCEGGIAFFEKIKNVHLNFRNASTDSFFKRKWRQWTISEQGNYLFDVFHPSNSIRLASLRQVAVS